MLVKHLSYQSLVKALQNNGLIIAVGPFVFSITSPMNDVIKNIALLYADFPCLTENTIVDFHVKVARPNSIRRWLKPQVTFFDDQLTPFESLPASQAFPLLEWGMNWSIAQHSHHYLMIHSAVLEKNGFTVMLPAASGSGKSTLCALLAINGWRLLSDEMALINTTDLSVQPLCRPISLKNESINVIKEADPQAVFSDAVDDTNKGRIAHLKPSEQSVAQMTRLAQLNAIVFPKYTQDVSLATELVDKADSAMAIIENSFNYPQLGEKGYETVNKLVSQVVSHKLHYSEVTAVLAFFERLSAGNIE